MRWKFSLFLVVLFILFSLNVTADYSYNAVSSYVNGRYYASDRIPCDTESCWVHQCTWVGVNINVPIKGSYYVKMYVIRDGSSEPGENIRLEVNGQSDYQLDDGSKTSYHTFGPFNFNSGINYIKFSSTTYGEFFYQDIKRETCLPSMTYESVHFNTFTLIPVCIDSDNDGVCDNYDRCVGQNRNNLPANTLCRRWFLNEYGCHEYTNLPSYTSCGTNFYEYSCYAGTYLGSDLYRRYHDFKCNGLGTCVDNVGSWVIYQYCDANTYCYSSPQGIYCKNATKENTCPKLNPINDVVAREGDLIKIIAPAVDVDNDTLYYSYSSPFNSSGMWKTSYTDSGNYTIQVNVSDSLCFDSRFFRLEVLDVDRNITPPINYTNQTNETKILKCFEKSNTTKFPINIVSVEVDRFDIYNNPNESFKFELGQDFIVEIKFIPLKNLTDLQIEGFINIDDYYETGNLTDITETFEVTANITYTKELYFKIPDEMFSGSYPLRLLFYDSSNIYDSCDYMLKVSLPEDCIVIKEMELIPEIIKAGRVLLVNGVIKNLCNETIDNIKVTASVPYLGISDYQTINNLTYRKSKEIEDLVLRIPVCTEKGDYTAKLSAVYDDEAKKVSKAEQFKILANPDCKEAENIDELVVIPNADNVYQEGLETVYNIIVTNPDDKTKTYILTVEGVDVFGDYRLDPGSVLVIPARKSQTSYLYVSAKKSEITGTKPIVITLESDKIDKETVTANIIKTTKKGFCSRFWDKIIIFWVRIRSNLLYSLLLILLAIIVFFFVMFLLFYKSKDEEEKRKI